MSVASEIERIKTNIANAYTELEKKGVMLPAERNSANLSMALSNVSSGSTGGSIEKGVIIEECDTSGYVTKAKVVGVPTLPDYAFYIYSATYATIFNKNLTDLDLSECTTSIGTYICSGCTNLSNVKLADTITRIGSYCFYNCKLNLTNLPNNITTILENAFYNCDLRLEKLPDTLTTLGVSSFSKNSNLAIKEIPAGVSSIAQDCFRYCTSITELDLKNETRMSLGLRCLANSGIQKLIIRRKGTIASLDTDALKSTPIASGTGYIYVPDDLVASYQSATNWSTYASQIKGVSEL